MVEGVAFFGVSVWGVYGNGVEKGVEIRIGGPGELVESRGLAGKMKC